MDHIPQPIFGLGGHAFEIPYLGGVHYSYDGLGFASYPARVGKELHTLTRDEGVISPADLEFLQAWLFFGVLDECLAVDYEDWITTLKSRTISFHSRLSTSKWILGLQERRSQVSGLGHREHELQKFDKCLEESVSILNNVIDARIMPTALGEENKFDRPDSPTLILFSIQILLSSLFASRAYIFSTLSEKHEYKQYQVEWHNGIVNLLLQRAGWSLRRTSGMETNIPLKFFLSRIQGNDRLVSWINPVKGSRGRITQLDNLSPKHTSLNCACEHFGIEEQDLLARKALNTKQVTLVRLNGLDSDAHISTTRGMQVIDAQGNEQPYIAFSHVRAQNLGNSTAHELPYCQLCFLQLLANSVHSTTGIPMAMYIDTLSVPFKAQYGRKELQNIQIIFKSAAAVIVLDQALITTYTGSDIDRLVRIRASEWKSRLWTLQEGLSARKLLFKFADGLHDLDEMLTNAPIEELFLLFGSGFIASNNEQNTIANLNYLEMFALDLKSLSSITLEAKEEVKFLLYTTLRLGYLSQSRYRYFGEDFEQRDSKKAVRLISRVYGGENEYDHDAIVSRLTQMYTLALEEGIGLHAWQSDS